MLRRLAQIELAVGIVLLAVIVGLVFVAAIMRFFNNPLIWSVDMAQLLFIWLCFLGAARALRERAHLGIDLAVRGFSHRWRLWIETALALAIVLFLLLLAREGYVLTLSNIERQFGDSGLSYAFVTVAVPVGCLMLALAIAVNAVRAWRARAAESLLIFARTNGADGA